MTTQTEQPDTLWLARALWDSYGPDATLSVLYKERGLNHWTKLVQVMRNEKVNQTFLPDTWLDMNQVPPWKYLDWDHLTKWQRERWIASPDWDKALDK